MVESGLFSALKKAGLTPSSEQRRALSEYRALLEDWNRRINLVSRSLAGNIYEELFYDSLVPALKGELGPENTCADIGTGAGIPGLILSIFNSHLEMDLVESVRKKVLFLEKACTDLELANATVVHRRAEDLNGSYGTIFFKAFKDITTCVKIGDPLLAPEGRMIIFKGTDFTAELDRARQFFPCYFYNIVQYILPESKKQRSLVIITKK